jgi:hypothetical protein
MSLGPRSALGARSASSKYIRMPQAQISRPPYLKPKSYFRPAVVPDISLGSTSALVANRFWPSQHQHSPLVRNPPMYMLRADSTPDRFTPAVVVPPRDLQTGFRMLDLERPASTVRLGCRPRGSPKITSENFYRHPSEKKAVPHQRPRSCFRKRSGMRASFGCIRPKPNDKTEGGGGKNKEWRG